MKRFSLLLLVVVLVTALAMSIVACNPGTPVNPVPTAEPSATEPAATDEDPEATEAPTDETATDAPSETEEIPSETEELPSGSEEPTEELPTEGDATDDPANTEDPGTATPGGSTATPGGKTPTSAPTNTPTPTPAESPTDEDPGTLANISFPDSSTTYSKDFAVSVLSLNMGADKTETASILTNAGLTVKRSYQVHYDKSADDRSHTSSFTYGTGKVSYKGSYRNVVVVVIRSTMTAGEWKSNFDFAPSHDDNTKYAENFLACAQDVYSYVKPVIQGLSNPLVLITGYSRGAATANLLGTLYNKDFGTTNGFVYTYATPNTIRNNNISAPNVFNIINPADPITMVPFKSLGYKRAGTDIILADSQNLKATTEALLEPLNELSKVGIKNMYETKYKLDGAGTDPEKGMTVFEFLDSISTSLGNMDQLDYSALLPIMSTVFTITPDSSLYPFRQFVEAAISTEQSKLESVAYQHKPVTYIGLLNAS